MSVPWIASYRLQLSKDFGFLDALAHLDYFRRLGVSHLYLSPVFESRPGSNHGYDVLDPNRISGERGGEDAFFRLCRAAEETGLGLILDIVPNHLAAGYDNIYWREVLKHGRTSPFADLFDIDWADDPQGKLVLPVLANPVERILAEGGLKIAEARGEHVLAYHDRLFPLSPRSLPYLDGPLEELLEAQNYRLTDWRRGTSRVNYRRFFDIGDLVAVRADRADVFERLHRKLKEILERAPAVQGLRVDHIDGLADPKAYLERLRRLCEDEVGRSVKIWVEKILGENETLPADWPCEGTTGYDFSRALDALAVDAAGLRALHGGFQGLGPGTGDFATACLQAKTQVLHELFPSEVRRLASRLARRTGLDKSEAHGLVVALTAALPVYRTYYTPADGWSGRDLNVLDRAFATAGAAMTDGKSALDRMRALLLDPDRETGAWIASWQQLTGPAMAKGYEDTVLYRYFPLSSLCEVGGQRTDCAVDPGETLLHLAESRRPLSMNATSSHDSKRGEDLRWRLHALSEMPELYLSAFARWAESEKALLPDMKILWFLFQSWLGLTGDESAAEERERRLQEYAVKALRESKLFSHWHKPDADLEGKAKDVLHRLCSEETEKNHAELLNRLERRGREISLRCTALKYLLPGFPDIYQGSESWNFRLVDPDNRRPVDFKSLAERLDKYREVPLADVPMGERKLALTHRLLLAKRNAFSDRP